VLSLLALALLCAYLAVTRRKFVWCVTTGILLGALVLTNAFAAVDLGIGMAIIAAVQPPGGRLRSLALLAGIGAAAYLWISPILTPDLVRTIRTKSHCRAVTGTRRRWSVPRCWFWRAPPASGISRGVGSTGSTVL
jgi:hypothetical protein